jgi:hypothetical protein
VTNDIKQAQHDAKKREEKEKKEAEKLGKAPVVIKREKWEIPGILGAQKGQTVLPSSTLSARGDGQMPLGEDTLMHEEGSSSLDLGASVHKANREVSEEQKRSGPASVRENVSEALSKRVIQTQDKKVLDVCIVSKARFQVVNVTPAWLRELTEEEKKERKKKLQQQNTKDQGQETLLKDGEGNGRWVTYCDVRVVESSRRRADMIVTDRCSCEELASAVYRAVEAQDPLLEVRVRVCVFVLHCVYMCICVCVYIYRERESR